MKKILNISKAMVAGLLLAVLSLFAACDNRFEESWELEVNSNEVTVPYEEGQYAVGCFCTGPWKAYLEREVSWARLENAEGVGTGYVRFIYTHNNGVSRAVNLILESEGQKQVIRLIQKTGVGDAEVAFDRQTVTYANGKYSGRLDIITNLPDECFADAETILVEGEVAPQNEEEGVAPDWITDVVYHKAEITGSDEQGNEVKSNPYITFTVQPYSGSEDRVAIMKYGLTDASGVEYYATATLIQDDADGYITIGETLVSREAQQNIRADIDTNLTEFVDDMTVSVEYDTEGARDYISNVALQGTKAMLDIAANTGTKRIARIVVSYTDLDGNETKGSFRVIQRGETIKRLVSAEAVREPLTSKGDYTYASISDDSGDYADALALVVIGSGTECANIGEAKQLGWNTWDITVGGKIAYAQSLDGKYGFCLNFDSADENILMRGDKLELSLDNLKITRIDSPVRYEISNISPNSIVVVENQPSAIVAKEKSISELTDADLYTEVTLKSVEFLVKDAAYVMGFASAGMTGVLDDANPAKAAAIKTQFATMMQDEKDDAIYLLINSACTWARDLTNGIQVPQGVGTAKGVLVHSEDKSYSNLGKYQLRPYDASSFNMGTAPANAAVEHAGFHLNLYTVSVGKYIWNGNTDTSNNGGYLTGNKTTTETYQNKLHATTGITDGSAVLYTTNLTPVAKHNNGQGGTTNKYTNNYHPGINDGYKAVKTVAATLPNADCSANSKATALCFVHDVASYYKWDENGNWTGETTGVVVEFPGASKQMSISFTIGSITPGKTNNSNVITDFRNRYMAIGFPLYWKVECSTDGGASWSRCTCALTGADQFMQNPTMLWFNGSYNYYTDALQSITTSGRYTPVEHCPSYVQHKFDLPATATGAAKVMIKISPASLRLAGFGVAYTDSIDTGVDCYSTYSYPHSLMLEDVSVTYAK